MVADSISVCYSQQLCGRQDALSAIEALLKMSRYLNIHQTADVIALLYRPTLRLNWATLWLWSNIFKSLLITPTALKDSARRCYWTMASFCQNLIVFTNLHKHEQKVLSRVFPYTYIPALKPINLNLWKWFGMRKMTTYIYIIEKLSTSKARLYQC